MVVPLSAVDDPAGGFCLTLLNAFCHSGARRIDLELEYADGNLTMRVRDDGRGIEPQVLGLRCLPQGGGPHIDDRDPVSGGEFHKTGVVASARWRSAALGLREIRYKRGFRG
jgi:signal transduction histidine kinase